MSEESLAELRQRIDLLDQEIIALLSQRAQIALAIGKCKKNLQLAIGDEGRESAVLAHIRQENARFGMLSDEAVEAIYRAIIQACRQVQYDDEGSI